ncbi:hypothetical protein VUR80DRAFT_9811 [Thermomyces stellatus]
MIADALETKTDPAGDIGEVRKVVNRSTLGQLTSKVVADSAADLTNLSSTHSKLYSSFVEILSQSTDPKTPGLDARGNARGSGDGPKPPTMAGYLSVSAGLPVEILYPLTSRFLDVIFEGQEVRAAVGISGSLSRDFVAVLNRRLTGVERLHELHKNFVLGLVPSVTVKAGSFLAVGSLVESAVR